MKIIKTNIENFHLKNSPIELLIKLTDKTKKDWDKIYNLEHAAQIANIRKSLDDDYYYKMFAQNKTKKELLYSWHISNAKLNLLLDYITFQTYELVLASYPHLYTKKLSRKEIASIKVIFSKYTVFQIIKNKTQQLYYKTIIAAHGKKFFGNKVSKTNLRDYTGILSFYFKSKHDTGKANFKKATFEYCLHAYIIHSKEKIALYKRFSKFRKTENGKNFEKEISELLYEVKEKSPNV